ncbi:MAG: HEAT repeat domain-containing protein, partial [Chloroflexota bacterium]
MSHRSRPGDLIARLDTADPRDQRAIGQQIERLGAAAVPTLIEALTSGPASTRKAAAFLLGRHKTAADAIAALCRAVADDSEPKVRKNAAVSLGRIGTPDAVEHLAAALERELVAWVRPSLILAIGAIGGEAAHQALGALHVEGDTEQEALRKATQRSAPRQHVTAWRRDRAPDLGLMLDVPAGLEEVASGEAAERSLGPLALQQAGRLRCPVGVAPWDVFPVLRCVKRLLIEAGQGAALDASSVDDSGRTLTGLIEESDALRRIGEWLQTSRDVVTYRLSVEGGRMRRDMLRALVQASRVASRRYGLVDSPSDYDLQLVIETGDGESRLYVVPSFVEDTRFAY